MNSQLRLLKLVHRQSDTRREVINTFKQVEKYNKGLILSYIIRVLPFSPSRKTLMITLRLWGLTIAVWRF